MPEKLQVPAIKYEVHEFEIPKDTIKNSTREKSRLTRFWEQVDEKRPGLPNAIGCYVYSIRAGKGLTPWYVGMTQKQSFKNECFQAGKLLILRNYVLDQYAAGNVIIHLIPKITPGGKLVRKGQHRDITWLEGYLAGLALSKNRDLANVKGMKFLKHVYVPGVLGRRKGKPGAAADSLKTSLGLD